MEPNKCVTISKWVKHATKKVLSVNYVIITNVHWIWISRTESKPHSRETRSVHVDI